MRLSLKPLAIIAALAVMAISAQGALAEKPKSVALVSWGVGGMFYSMSSAVADGVKKVSGIKTNIIPSSNDTGRLLPVKTGEAQMFIAAGSTGWLGTRGAGIFSQPQWGPQRLRIAWRGGAYYTAFWTRGDSGINSLKDVKGKRVGQVPGSPTLNWLLQGAVAFGGYNLDQVQVVNLSGYGPACKAVIQGALDLFVSSTTSGYVRECAAKPAGIRWMDLDPADKDGWQRLWSFVPWAGYGSPEIYAGKDKGVKPFTALKYAAFFWSYDNIDADTIYYYAKGIWDSYDIYKDKHPRLAGWDHRAAADLSTCMFPFHPGLIRLLKEKGVWTDKHEAFQKAQLKKEEERFALWDQAKADAGKKGMKVGDDAFQKMWKEMLIAKGVYR
ncbi:MAG: TAXI family TRAP transporter solute-binding subunit [Proteobacteria bacterium]|nr:TAXI family TRAP transporter solute-binding subunit [Pseudomonadota bacterium]MBU2468254.1 TAXI family TRAP transporter solute-binding subunit [Pseudomonadota bacterium]MBU2518182.1 TAXI family TRAP transporter solute-binding subunit [Pseudomonadota bacterium]